MPSEMSLSTKPVSGSGQRARRATVRSDTKCGPTVMRLVGGGGDFKGKSPVHRECCSAQRHGHGPRCPGVAPGACPQADAAANSSVGDQPERQSFSRLWVVQKSDHSSFALPKPRRRKLFNRRSCIWPKTDSTVPARCL